MFGLRLGGVGGARDTKGGPLVTDQVALRVGGGDSYECVGTFKVLAHSPV